MTSTTYSRHGAIAMTTTQTKLLTADDLLRLYSKGVRGELIRGVLCETMAVGGEHGEIVMNLGGEMRSFIKPRRLGRLAGSDAGVWLERDPDTVREPDLAFISSQKLPLNVRNPGYYEVVPDLVVEIASPSDSRREVNDKAQDVAPERCEAHVGGASGYSHYRRPSRRRLCLHSDRKRYAGRRGSASWVHVPGERDI